MNSFRDISTKEDLENGHVRVNTIIRNNTENDLVSTIFNQTKNQAFIENCFNYDLVIEKLTVNASQVGIFSYGFDLDANGNYNQDKYTITLRCNNIDYTVPLRYIQNDFIFPNLRIVYNVADFVQMVNQAFKEAFDLIPVPDRGTITQPPFIYFKNQNETLKMRYQSGYVNRSVSTIQPVPNPSPPPDTIPRPPYEANEQPTPTIEVFVNYELYVILFQGFPVEFGQENRFLGPKVARFNIIDDQSTALFVDPNAPEPQPSAGDNYIIQIEQQWTSYYNLYDVNGIIIKSSTFPASKTLVTNQTTGGNVLQESILTRFTISQFGSGNKSNSEIIYLPQPSYRRIPLYSNTGLDTINYTVEYETKYGTSVPFNLNPGESLELDLLFIKKTLPN